MPSLQDTPTIERLSSETHKFGMPELVDLTGQATYRHMDYLDLFRERQGEALKPDAVAEFQGRPLVYLLDGFTAEYPEAELINLQQLLANRSEHACLAIVRPGDLEVRPINLSRQQLEQGNEFQFIHATDAAAPTFFQSLATGKFTLENQPKKADFVFHEIHSLLSKASEALIGKLPPLQVLSVIGRALFFRFLIDRNIVRESEREAICPQAQDLYDVFSDAEKAAQISLWMDVTFNGDLLPLVPELPSDVDSQVRLNAYRTFFQGAGNATNNKVFLHQQAILKSWKSLDKSEFQPHLPEIDWDDLDFAHIPIGVLSQVYETFSRQWDEAHATETGVYYTPKNIATLMVEEALAGLDNPAEAHLLDPACGAGVFLVLAFRHLVQKCWERDGKRPTTSVIHNILYEQLCGFDVSESALRLAALALHIMAVELNGTQRPPISLKLPRRLQDEVLYNWGDKEANAKRRFVSGSLGPNVPESFNQQFDVVIGNPPWTRLRASSENAEEKKEEKAYNDALNKEFTATARRVLKARNVDEANAYENPDNNPDLPFLWRAAEWAKPDGIIALVLPARIILKQAGKGKSARDAIMRGFQVNGIINGSDLEKTHVWPNMDLPFMLLFARNAKPEGEHHFYFATPVRENHLADQGQFRLDYKSAEAVSAQQVIDKPWLLKTLGVGAVLDVEIIEKLKLHRSMKALSEHWKKPLFSGKGFSIEPRKKSEAPEWLKKLPVLKSPVASFRASLNGLDTFAEVYGAQEPHHMAIEEIYKSPLLIIRKKRGEKREAPQSFRVYGKSICYSQSYYGFSASGHADGESLISLLYLITNSVLFQHFCLACSSSIGAQHRIILKEDLDAFPFPSVSTIEKHKQHILELADALENSSTKPWGEIDKFIFQLYGLDEHDAQVVKDTVKYGAPYRSARQLAEAAPKPAEANAFCGYLEEIIQPFFDVVDQRVNVSLVPPLQSTWDLPIAPWRFLAIGFAGDSIPTPPNLLAQLMEEANRTAASRVVMHIPESGLLIGLLNQQRFWTLSRARLCGLHILREHMDAFPMPNLK